MADRPAEAESSGMLELRWNSHIESLQCIFDDLLEHESFVDVTLCCEGGAVRAHRIMLSACSSYFRRVLFDNSCKHPVVIMRDVLVEEMQAILHFMYRGEIRVPEKRLASLLKTAKLLEIRGLAEEFFNHQAKKYASQDNSEEQTNCRKRKTGQDDDPVKKSEEHDSASPGTKPKKNKTSSSSPKPKATNQTKTNRPSSALDLSSETLIDNSDSENSGNHEAVNPGHEKNRETAVASPLPLLVQCEQENIAEGKTQSDGSSPHPDAYPFSVLEEQGSSVVQAVCPFCFKDCKRTAELRAHIRAHTGEKPFRCDICNAPFARSAHLKRHRRVHTGERPFECLRCQKTFSRQDKLKLHMDRHRLRDMGGKMVVGRPRKNQKIEDGGEEAASTSCLPSPASASTPTPTPTPELGMGQFAFPGAAARPGPPQSPLSSGLPSPGLPLSFSDIGYLSLLSLSHKGLPGASGDVPSGAITHLRNAQALQEIQALRKPNPSRGRGRGRGRTTPNDSASEALLNFAQQVGGTPQSPVRS